MIDGDFQPGCVGVIGVFDMGIGTISGALEGLGTEDNSGATEGIGN